MGVLRATQITALWKRSSLSSGLEEDWATVSSAALPVQTGHTLKEAINVIGPATGMGSSELSSLCLYQQWSACRHQEPDTRACEMPSWLLLPYVCWKALHHFCSCPDLANFRVDGAIRHQSMRPRGSQGCSSARPGLVSLQKPCAALSLGKVQMTCVAIKRGHTINKCLQQERPCDLEGRGSLQGTNGWEPETVDLPQQNATQPSCARRPPDAVQRRAPWRCNKGLLRTSSSLTKSCGCWGHTVQQV